MSIYNSQKNVPTPTYLSSIRQHTDLTDLADVNGTPLTISGQILVWDNDNKYFENIFVSEQAGELWRKPNMVENKIDSKNNESVVAISADGNYIYLYNGEEGGGDIMVSELKKGTTFTLNLPMDEGAYTYEEKSDRILWDNDLPKALSITEYDQGNEVGEVDVHLYDPDHGFLWNKEVFPTLQKGLIYLTTQTESEIKAEEIDTITYPEHKIPYIVNGRNEEKTYYSNAKLVFLKEIASNGKVTVTSVKRKRILEENYSDLIAGFTAEGIDFENESEATAKLLREYKVVVDSVTQVKTLVLRG